MKRRIGLPILLFLLIIMIPIFEADAQLGLSEGVYDNSDFSRPAKYWSDAAHRLGSKNGIVDLVVAQAGNDGFVYLAFPFESQGYLHSSSQTDQVELYLKEFDSESLKVILSIQPLKADVTQLIGILLSRYSKHDSIIGVNVDIEYKESGVPYYVNDEERDMWLNEIKNYNSTFEIYLTYFRDYTHFPDDTKDLVILFDGEGDTQVNLLRQYGELAGHYNSVGIYTGYLSSVPTTASNESIIAAAPNTRYIIHTDDVSNQNQPQSPRLIELIPYFISGLLAIAVLFLIIRRYTLQKNGQCIRRRLR